MWVSGGQKILLERLNPRMAAESITMQRSDFLCHPPQERLS